jgi:hypothetical protein
MPFTTEQLSGIVRAILAAAGGGAIFSADVLTSVAGALVTIGVAVWSYYSNKKKPVV